MIDTPTPGDIRALRETLRAHVRTTPCLELRPGELMSDSAFDSTLVFKLELFQLTGSFKVRGALAGILSLHPDERSRGVTAVSAGNHAIAVSYAAHVLGVSAHVVMMKTANPARVDLARRYGAEVEFAEDGASAFRRVKEIETAEGRAFIHPFEGPRPVLGTATLGAEFLEQAGTLDAVVIAAGGGGLLAGVAAAIKASSPSIRVFGVEPVGADSLTRSLAAGKPVTLDRVVTIADSLAPPMATPYTFEVCRQCVDRIVLVDDESLRLAMGVMFRDLKLAVEPAGAAALAAVLGPLRGELAGGQRVGVVVCGSNIDLETFYRHTSL